MNIMAAGAKEGAAEIPELALALKQTGAASKALGVSFVETVASLETLAKGGKQGAEAGIALRNILSRLVKVTPKASKFLAQYGIDAEQFSETLGKDGLNAAMKDLRNELKKVQDPTKQSAILIQLFGQENFVAAQTLVNLTEDTDNFTAALEGTNTALDQANVKMDTTSQKWKRFTTFIENEAVASLEKAQSAIGNLFAGVADVVSGDGDLFDRLGRAGISLIEATGDVIDYSTLGIIKTNKWMGLTQDVGDATGELKAGNQELSDTVVNTAGNIETLDNSVKKLGSTIKKAVPPIAGSLGEMDNKLRELNAELRDRLVPGTKEFALKLGEIGAQERSIKAIKDAMIVPEGTKLIFDEDFGEIIGDLGDLPVDEITNFQQAWAMLGLTMGTVGEVFQTAFSGGDDAMKNALKAILNVGIGFLEAEIAIAAGFSTVSALLSGGISLFKDAPLLAAAFVGLQAAKGFVGSFRTGLDYVPKDAMPAILHKGEAVLPQDEADNYRSGGGKFGSGNQPMRVQVHISRFETAIEDAHVNRSRRIP